MSGKGELVRYTRLRAPKEKAHDDNLTYEELKNAVSDLIDTAAQGAAKVTIIALVELEEDQKKKET